MSVTRYPIRFVIEANFLQVAANMGLTTFPTPGMNWHFDDKIAETCIAICWSTNSKELGILP